MQQLPRAFAALAARRQFIVYKVVPGKKPGKLDKFPINPTTCDVVSAHDSANWYSFEEAAQFVALFGEGYGVGYTLTRDDPFFFVDLDNCIDAAGNWSPVAVDIFSRFPDAAKEISTSRTGAHVIGTGLSPDHGCKNPVFGLEFYTEGRFIALTGYNASGDAGVDCTVALYSLVNDYFPVGKAKKDIEWTEEPMTGYDGPENDEELIAMMLRSRSAASIFGGTGKASFADLWNKNVDVLKNAYPDNYGQREYDASSADSALASHLAFWTGHDCGRMLRLMNLSSLKRDKWQKHKSYLTTTIKNACGFSDEFYTSKKNKTEKNDPPPVPVEPVIPVTVAQTADESFDVQFREGFQYLAPTQQVEMFKGCVYIQELHKVMIPSGELLNAERFRVVYGGYTYALDSTNTKTTKNAWEVFTESQAVRFPKVVSSIFRPDLPPGKLINDEGRSAVNIYYPPSVRVEPGNIDKFMTHLSKLLPNEGDREIVLSYMAACVQHQGVKFQWTPLIQGTEGNGKTLLSRCVAYAVGERYSHWPNASDIANKFNAWIVNKVFIGVEDIYVPEHKREVIEALKPMITNTRQDVQAKREDQKSMHVVANFMLNSNHKDAVKKTRDDRRFAVFYTAQQSYADVQRDGMDGQYMPDLYDWLKGENRYAGQTPGYAMVAHFLKSYQIKDELNPATSCHRAPITSTTNDAINQSLGSIEQEIAEAIDEGRPGFANGWVSSMALEKLLKDMRADRMVPPNKRRALMQSLGYDYHPGLPGGRVNNPIAFDGGRPRLYAREGHLNNQITGVAAITRAYEEAQIKQPDPAAARAFGSPIDGAVNKG